MPVNTTYLPAIEELFFSGSRFFLYHGKVAQGHLHRQCANFYDGFFTSYFDHLPYLVVFFHQHLGAYDYFAAGFLEFQFE